MSRFVVIGAYHASEACLEYLAHDTEISLPAAFGPRPRDALDQRRRSHDSADERATDLQCISRAALGPILLQRQTAAAAARCAATDRRIGSRCHAHLWANVPYHWCARSFQGSLRRSDRARIPLMGNYS